MEYNESHVKLITAYLKKQLHYLYIRSEIVSLADIYQNSSPLKHLEIISREPADTDNLEEEIDFLGDIQNTGSLDPRIQNLLDMIKQQRKEAYNKYTLKYGKF